MSRKHRTTRRRFLQVGTLTASSIVLASCAAPEPTPALVKAPPATAVPAKAPQATAAPAKAAPAAATPTAAVPSVSKEVPALADLVKAGKLPPVADRLPREPKVVNEMAPRHLKLEIGRHGGVLRLFTLAPDDDPDVYMMINEPLLNSPSLLAEEITGNILRSYQVSDDQKEFTFFMRQGLRWSDGQPVTTEDVRFAVEDVLLNKELYPQVPVYLRAGGDSTGAPLKLEVASPTVFKIRFDKPYGGFPLALAIRGWIGYHDLLKPKHYLQQFHKQYTPLEKLKPLWEAAKLEGWVQLFALKDVVGRQANRKDRIGIPKLHPWILTAVDGGVYTYERNPYYFKVDAAGNQLPYVDKITSTVVPDIEMIGLKMIAGETDLSRRWPTLVKMPLYKENEKKGGFKTILGIHHVTPTDIHLNLTYKDPVWRQVVRDKRFRQALNYAIDRKEIIDTIYYGVAEPSDWAPSEFNLDKANKLLDEMGLDKRDADRFRLGPDGKTFVIPFEVAPHATDIIPVAELVVQFWNKVGVKTTMKTLSTQLRSQRSGANEIQATVMWTSSPMWYYVELGLSNWGQLWQRWSSTGGRDGEEPPEDVKAFLKKFDSLMVGSIDESRKTWDEIRKMMYDNIFCFIPIYKVKQPMIVNAKLGNVSESEDAYPIATNFAAEQMFYRA